MEAECDPQIDGSVGSGQSRISQTFHGSELDHRSQGLQELSELHVPTHDFKHDSEPSDPRCRFSPDIASPGVSSHTRAVNTVHQNSSAVNTSNVDRCSVRSSTQTTASNSAASLPSSSGAFSMAMTVSSAPTSMSSRFSDASGGSILELEKGVFAAPKMPLDLKDRSSWDNIRPRLQDTIDNTLRTRQGLESTISCEFMMGGPSPKQLKPTVLLVCCHEAYRKPLKGILKRQKWIRQYDYQWVVLVDAFEELSFGSLEVTPGTDAIRVYASFSSKKNSLCGVQALGQAREHKEIVRFTIGGILLIDNKEFGLTVGHVVEKLILPQDGTSDADDEEDSDSSPFMTFEVEDPVKITGLSSTERLASVSEDVVDHDEPSIVWDFDPQEDGLIWSDFGHVHASTISRSTMRRKQLDWSLVSLGPELETFQRPLINTFEIPTGRGVSINKFLQKSAIVGSEVWINAGSTGTVRGWLMDSMVVFYQHGQAFPVLQVISDQPLAPGDSGSWVLMDNVLCGHVLASRKSVPWLYILPIFDILTEVKATFSCSNVILPQNHCHPGRNDLMNESIKLFPCGPDTILAERAEIRSTTHQQTENSNSPPHSSGSTPFLVPHNLRLVIMTDIFRACLGSMYLENASTERSNYSAFEDYCLSTMRHLHIDGFDGAVVLDIMQMIRCGLHKHEIIATLQQRMSSGPNLVQSIGESVDRVASLLVMVDIGEKYELGWVSRPQRMEWAHGNLRDTIGNHFKGQMDLSDMDIRLDPTFTTENLVKIAGLRISWTANLADHLRLDGKQKVMHVFHHVTFLECQRKSPESLLPKGLVEETLTTLALLFPSQSSKATPSWIRAKATASASPYDSSLHSVGMEPVELYKREFRTFYHWHDRLVILKRALDEQSATHSPIRLWYDRRNIMQWYTFLVAVLVAMLSVLSVCLSTVQVVLSGVQLSRLSVAQSGTASTGQHISSTSSLSPMPTVTASSVAIDGGGHHLSSGAIVGITFAAVGVCGAVVAIGIYSYRIRRKRSIARDMVNFTDGDIVNLVDGPKFVSNSKADRERNLGKDQDPVPSYCTEDWGRFSNVASVPKTCVDRKTCTEPQDLH